MTACIIYNGKDVQFILFTVVYMHQYLLEVYAFSTDNIKLVPNYTLSIIPKLIP